MFDSLLTSVQRADHRFTVYTDDGSPSVDNWFANHSVDVTLRPLPTGAPEPFVTIERGGEFAGVLSLEAVERLLEPPIDRPETPEDLPPTYQALFEVLDETVYTSIDREEMVAVSEEIEDRAQRTGSGTLHAGFQRLSRFRQRLSTYRRLASTGLEVHVYGVADWDPPAVPGVSYHTTSGGPLARYWVLAFDGGDEPTRSCGLLARQEADGYTGFWTDDPAMVAEIIDRLEAITA
ncbi:DICT sensory domain-containing protein [Halolamina litorea]|uniref:DICT sensory domain-containing protein n=1 Tax=Halolamina litorea TaxID=1515593 RepID=A0ABD6BQM7_9EURY|nr:DICT sensory domain-containing protein [Halolamina litorea]